jgi:hypothetical protein
MSGFLKALEDFPKPVVKKHFVIIQDKQYEVPLEKKLEIMQHGEGNYTVKTGELGTEFVLKPKPKPKTRYSVLRKAGKGYSFEQGDIHWPNGIVENGETWLIEYE